MQKKTAEMLYVPFSKTYGKMCTYLEFWNFCGCSPKIGGPFNFCTICRKCILFDRYSLTP